MTISTEGDVDNDFNIDDNCSLTLVGELDFEHHLAYDLTIEATDLDPVSPKNVSMVIQIQVVDVNEKPVSIFFQNKADSNFYLRID